MATILSLLFLTFATVHSSKSFLASQLPFNVVSMTPSSTSLLAADTSLTVIFTRPVISLGSDFAVPLKKNQIPFSLVDEKGIPFDFPMKLRYVTTFIARLDLDIFWPPDLSLNWSINPNLHTFDGLNLGVVPPPVHFTTYSLSGGITTVDSPKALSLTDGYWSSKVGQEPLHEVPPDGSFNIEFSYPVETEKVKKALILLDAKTLLQINEQTISLRFSNCSTDSDTLWRVNKDSSASFANNNLITSKCLKVFPDGIRKDSCYILRLPKDTDYNQYAGSLGKNIDFEFCGMRKFIFPFTTPWQVKYRRYDLWLRHGLAESVSLDIFRSVLTIEASGSRTKLPYNISLINRGTLRISTNFLPGITYTITVLSSNDIKDGFNQPLLASSHTFTTSGVSNFFVTPEQNQFVVFEKFATKWKALSRYSSLDSGYENLAITTVNEKNIASLVNDNSGNNINKEKSIIPISDGQLHVLEEDENSADRHLFLRNIIRYYSSSDRSYAYSGLWTSITDIGLTALSYDGHIIVWATSFTTGIPINDLQVTAYSRYKHSDFRPVHNLTNSDGITTLVTNENPFIFASLEKKDIAVIPDVYVPRFYESDFQGTILTDRAIYKPGEKMHIKCYVRARNGFQWQLPQSGMVWKLESVFKPHDYVTNEDEIKVSLNPVWDQTYGSFHTTITIPEGSSYGEKQWSLVVNKQTWISTTSFTIADPRRPTARLEISTSSNVYIPSTSLPVNIKVETGTGLPIGNAKIALEWEVTTPARYPDSWRWWIFDPPIITSGITEIISGSDGIASSDLNLPAKAGDSIKVSAIWVGPTGELIEESFKIESAISEWKIEVETSPQNPLPGFPFGLLVSMRDHNDNLIEDQMVTVKLLAANGSIIQNCLSKSSILDVQCSDFVLPTANKYSIYASATDPRGTNIDIQLELGKTPEEWDESPLTSFSTLSMQLDQQRYSNGDTAELSFYNPFPKARILLIWGDRTGKKMKQILLEKGQAVIFVPLGRECSKGCALVTILHVPRIGKDALSLPVDIPISPLFDLYAPRAIFQTLPISVTFEDVHIGVNLQVQAKEGVVLPGSETQVSVSLIDKSTNTKLSGEVAVFAVDRAFLDLKPHKIRDLQSDDFSINQEERYEFRSSFKSLGFQSGYNASIQTAIRRINLDPWISVSLPVIPKSGLDIVSSDSTFLSKFSTKITHFPSRNPYNINPVFTPNNDDTFLTPRGAPGPPQVEESMPVSPDTSKTSFGGVGGGSDISVPSSAPVPLRTDFETAPLFLGNLMVDTSGSTFTFKLPDTIGTFVIRAYAVDTANHFGSSETTLISRRPISTQPALPRFARVGDKFNCGVTVTASKRDFENEINVLAKADSSISITNQVATVHVVGTNPVAAQVEMEAVAIGDVVLRFTTNNNGAIVDDLEAKLPVIGVQNPVYVATSMAISGKNSKDSWIWSEGFDFPPAVPGSGSVDIAAGVGRFSSVQMLRDILAQDTTYLNGELLISRAGLKNAFWRYGSESALDELYSQSLKQLRLYSSSSLGLRWSIRYQQTQPYARINAYALHIAARLSSFSFPEDLVTWWTQALEKALLQQVLEMRRTGGIFADFDLLADVYLAMGTEWIPSDNFDKDLLPVVGIGRLLSNIDKCSLEGKLKLSLAYLMEVKTNDIIEPILQEVISSFRVQGRTAYISYLNQHASARSLGIQALGLSVLALHGEYLSNPLVEKLANYVSQGNAHSAGFFFSWRSRDIALATIALADYDEIKQNNEPNLVLKIKCKDNLLLNAHFDSVNSPIAHVSKKYSELPKLELYGKFSDPPTLQFSGTGQGEVSVALGLNFIPAKILRDPVYRGIFVERIIQRLDVNGMTTGPNIQLIESGTIVEITIQFTTPDDLSNVMVEDLLPAGLEPLDNQNTNLPVWYGRWWSSWYHSREIRPDSVTWQFHYVQAGSHSLSYQAIANTVGTFSLPPAKASVRVTPEVMGLSGGGCFVVSSHTIPLSDHKVYLEQHGCQQQSVFSPHMCAEDCGSQKICNLTSGLCQTLFDKLTSDYNPLPNNTINPTQFPSANSYLHLVPWNWNWIALQIYVLCYMHRG